MPGKPKPASKNDRPDKTLERELEEGLEETFPASDPVAGRRITTGDARKSKLAAEQQA
ncbi:MAG: hypothetical protein ACREB2_03155 [Pseudolabrys sp.]